MFGLTMALQYIYFIATDKVNIIAMFGLTMALQYIYKKNTYKCSATRVLVSTVVTDHNNNGNRTEHLQQWMQVFETIRITDNLCSISIVCLKTKQHPVYGNLGLPIVAFQDTHVVLPSYVS